MSNLLYECDDSGVGLLTFNRPDVHNALNLETIAELRALLDELRCDDELRALAVTGAGEKAFVSGGDLKEFQGLTGAEAARSMTDAMKENLELLSGLEVPVIAAVNGYALGGGCEVVLACDYRIAADSARLGFRQVKVGVISGWGGGPRLLRQLGRAQALRLMLTGQVLTAAEALEVGLVQEVVPAAQVRERALALGREIAGNPPLAVRAFKRLARFADNASLAEAIAYETELFGPVWVSEDHDEAIQAHFAKRPPTFRGR
ncbi:MAG: enoyl-CoA hydratase/isomerase family protein [Gemmatimonadetes bacterium]|nr:enoyl-CoA hydratase/isomerase family protein [Gemmatimonadota bacterium]